jgi:hypothetical protein
MLAWNILKACRRGWRRILILRRKRTVRRRVE